MFELLAQTTELTATKPAAETANGWVIFGLIIGVFTVPHLLSWLITKVLRVPEYSQRLGAVLMALIASITPVGYQMVANGKTLGECFRMGIDLAGGTNLVYRVDPKALSELKKDLNTTMEHMVGAISRRINPSGAEDVTVRRVGEDRIEVIVPGADQAYVAEMKDRMTRIGTLEFEILATESNPEHRGYVRKARALSQDEDIVTENGLPVARWTSQSKKADIGVGGGESLPAVFRDIKRDGADIRQWLLVMAPENKRVTGEFLTQASEQLDSRSGTLAVGFRFDDTGALRFLDLTTKYKPLKDGNKYRLAVVLDGKIESAPNLNSPIGESGQITGNFTRDEVRSLIDVLNAGALELPLDTNPVSEFSISPLLGMDVREKGITACLIAALIVVVFMLVYYHKAGFVADVSLILNIFLTVALMVFVQASFTLPGLAGLALTLGMAVDANVLIYERMREEVGRGASVKLAIHNGFDKAFSAIFDSNLTTLIAAVILYMVGTDQVKGFAVTLFIGIVTSMFSALYFGRLMFEVMERLKLLRKLTMMQVIKTPQVDFMGKRKQAFAVSGVVIAIGLAAAIYRGADNFDIDFRGGTMVTFQFDQAKASSEFRSALEEKFGSSISLERLTTPDDPAGDKGIRWRLRTVVDDQTAVEKGLTEALSSFDLRKITMKTGEIVAIPEEKVAEGETASKAKAAFEGGHEVMLTFSEKVTLTTARQSVFDGLATVPAAKAKAPKPDLLTEFEGIKVEGEREVAGKLPTFSQVKFRAKKDLVKDDLTAVFAATEKELASSPLFEEVTNFARAVGGETQQQALLAIGLSLISILLYVWFRFESWSFGIGGIAALFHDVAIAALALPVAGLLAGTPIGAIFGFEDFKINLPVIAALLTIVGYSINDTIVIFDRIREMKGKNPDVSVDLANEAQNQMLSRTLLTSTTTLLTTLVLYIMGGESIHGFMFCMLIGFISGVYSTIYIACPVMLWVIAYEKRKALRPTKKPAAVKAQA